MTLADGSVGVVKRHDRASAVSAEVAGLRWLAAAGAVPVPAVREHDDEWLIIDYVEPGSPTRAGAGDLGQGLARLHRSGAPAFGSPPPGGPVDAWIGLAPMRNVTSTDWPSWYAAHRLEPYLRTATDQGHELRAVGEVCERISTLVGPAEPPARLHGDLWNGNVVWSVGGAWLIDPAAHGGHRETDLAMLHLFGCPHLERVIAGYEEVFPLADGWRDRIPLHQLFPLLVHTVVVRRWLRAAGGGGGPGGAERITLPYRCGVRLKFLLRPGWLALTAAVLVFAGLCFAVLAPWQFGRHAERSATNDAITRSMSAEPTPVREIAELTEWRRVTATGIYLADDELVARLRTAHGEPAFEILTPFRLADGSVVLVDRGYVRPERGEVPSYREPPAGEVTVTAWYRHDERDRQDRNAPPGQVYAVDSRAVAEETGLSIRPGYLALTDESPGVLSALPLPELESGPYLSYALQWITFGVMALLAWLYFTWREIRPGGVLASPRGGDRAGRQSVAQQIAEEEARERAASR